MGNTASENVTGINETSSELESMSHNELAKLTHKLLLAGKIAGIGVWEYDLNAQKFVADEVCRSLYSISVPDVELSLDFWLAHVHPEDKARVLMEFENAIGLHTECATEFRIVRATGTVHVIKAMMVVERAATGNPLRIIGIHKDITIYKNAEQALRESEAKYRAFFENSMDGLLLTETDGNILAANPAACEIFKMTEGEICELGRMGLVDSADARVQMLITERQLNGKTKGEITYKRSDGTTFPGEITAAAFTDACGNKRTSIIIRDMTKRKEAETEKEKITLDMIQRNKDLEQFNYIVSHNIRSHVANITGICQLLNEELLPSDTHSAFWKQLCASVGYLDEVIKDLNSILQTKKEIQTRTDSVHFSRLIDHIKESIFCQLHTAGAVITTNFSEVDVITGNKSYLLSIFYNLISNSIKYCKPGEPPVVHVCSRREGDRIRLTFKDNGLGIDMEKKGDQLFRLYKRLHHHVEGKGMGLFMTKTQVESLGGTIQIMSKLNEGTEVSIVL